MLRTMLQAHVAHKCGARRSHTNATYKCRCIHTTSQASVTSKADMQMLRTHVAPNSPITAHNVPYTCHRQMPHACYIHMFCTNLSDNVAYNGLPTRITHMSHTRGTYTCHVQMSHTMFIAHAACKCHVQLLPPFVHTHVPTISQTNVTDECNIQMSCTNATCKYHVPMSRVMSHTTPWAHFMCSCHTLGPIQLSHAHVT